MYQWKSEQTAIWKARTFHISNFSFIQNQMNEIHQASTPLNPFNVQTLIEAFLFSSILFYVYFSTLISY